MSQLSAANSIFYGNQDNLSAFVDQVLPDDGRQDKQKLCNDREELSATITKTMGIQTKMGLGTSESAFFNYQRLLIMLTRVPSKGSRGVSEQGYSELYATIGSRHHMSFRETDDLPYYTDPLLEAVTYLSGYTTDQELREKNLENFDECIRLNGMYERIPTDVTDFCRKNKGIIWDDLIKNLPAPIQAMQAMPTQPESVVEANNDHRITKVSRPCDYQSKPVR